MRKNLVKAALLIITALLLVGCSTEVRLDLNDEITISNKDLQEIGLKQYKYMEAEEVNDEDFVSANLIRILETSPEEADNTIDSILIDFYESENPKSAEEYFNERKDVRKMVNVLNGDQIREGVEEGSPLLPEVTHDYKDLGESNFFETACLEEECLVTLTFLQSKYYVHIQVITHSGLEETKTQTELLAELLLDKIKQTNS